MFNEIKCPKCECIIEYLLLPIDETYELQKKILIDAGVKQKAAKEFLTYQFSLPLISKSDENFESVKTSDLKFQGLAEVYNCVGNKISKNKNIKCLGVFYSDPRFKKFKGSFLLKSAGVFVDTAASTLPRVS